MYILRGALLQFITLFALAGCNMLGNEKKFPDTDMYDLSRPKVIELPDALNEISGIAYYSKDTSVFAIVDEDGLLYKIPIMQPHAIKQWRFGKQRDYEDIVLTDSVFHVLVSNGDIVSLRFKGNTIFADKSDFSTQSKKTNEFEAMYFNTDSANLVIMCKECEEDTKRSFSTFSFNPNDSEKLYHIYMVMDGMQIAEKVGGAKFHLKASAAAINPVTADLYILSAINNILVVASRRGDVKQVYKLNPGIYKQAEGMAFTPEGDLIISNEYAGEGFAELLVLKNKLKRR